MTIKWLVALIPSDYFVSKKDTKFNYLPNDRVIGDFKKKNISFDSSFYGLDTITILNNSNINFSKSIINNNDCNNYFVETIISKIKYNFTAISCDDEVKFENLITSP